MPGTDSSQNGILNPYYPTVIMRSQHKLMMRSGFSERRVWCFSSGITSRQNTWTVCQVCFCDHRAYWTLIFYGSSLFFVPGSSYNLIIAHNRNPDACGIVCVCPDRNRYTPLRASCGSCLSRRIRSRTNYVVIFATWIPADWKNKKNRLSATGRRDRRPSH
jgi:hypothetical protein